MAAKKDQPKAQPSKTAKAPEVVPPATLVSGVDELVEEAKQTGKKKGS